MPRKVEIKATLICPSDWTMLQVKEWVERQILSSKEEQESLVVFSRNNDWDTVFDPKEPKGAKSIP